MKHQTIGFLIPEFPGQTHIAWWRVARELRDLGHEVRILSTRRQDASGRVHHLLEQEAENAIFAWPPRPGHVLGELVRNPAGLGRAMAYLLSLRQSSVRQKAALFPLILSALYLCAIFRKERIGHVFVHSCANAAHLLAICNRMMGVRYALRLGGDPDVYGRDHGHKMERADFVLSASPTYFDELADRHGVDRAKLFWSWVGTDLDAYTTDAAWPDNREADILRIATVARLNLVKGHLDVLEAFARLIETGRKAQYTLIGEGPYRKEIEATIARLDLGAYVQLLGPMDTSEIAEILKSTDVTVLASFGAGEAAPAVICESMAAGVPVIATRIGATEHMIRNGVDGCLVPQRDTNAILDHLSELADDPGRLAEMKRAAKVSSAQFDVRLTAKRIVELFAQADGRQNPGKSQS